MHSDPTVAGRLGFPPPPPPYGAPPGSTGSPGSTGLGVAGTLGRTVPVMLPMAALPWLAFRVDVVVGVVVCLLGAVLYAGAAWALLRVLGVDRAGLVGPIATVLAGVAQLSWAVTSLFLVLGLDAGRTDEAAVGANALGLLAATALGATIAVLLLHVGRGVPWPLPVALLVLVLAVPIGSGVLAAVVDERADDRALRADLEASGQPYLLPDLDGLEPTYVSSDRALQATAGLQPQIQISYARTGVEGYEPPAAYVTIRDLPAGSLCEELTVLPDEPCTESDGVAALDDGFRPQVAVDHGDAMLVVEPGFGDDELTLAELQELAPALRNAPEVDVETLLDVD